MAYVLKMSETLRISSPAVFEECLSKSNIFGKYNWMFDNNPTIITGFKPHITLSFEADERPLTGYYGYSKSVCRDLVVHKKTVTSQTLPSVRDLEKKTYISITHHDHQFLKLSDQNGQIAEISLQNIFHANDVQAAQMAVNLNIGFSALPKFIIEDEENIIRMRSLQVCPTYLRIQSRGDKELRFGDVHERLLHIISTEIGTSWEAFGHEDNIISMDGA